jgi:signal transduction histidine kinase/ActR/RegA family two-component response regulator
MVIAALALAIAVGGLVAWSARVLDTVERQDEIRLAERRVARTLNQLREDVVSAAVWDDAYEAMDRRDMAWLQINFGDYYADYMRHEVTLAFDGAGEPVYASRKSEPVAPSEEAPFVQAIAPLVAAVRQESAARGPAVGLPAVVTRQGVVLAKGEPYFVSVSTILRETPDRMARSGGAPVVASGVKVASFVPSLAADLGLREPELIGAGVSSSAPSVKLIDVGGRPVGALAWRAAKPGRELLMRAAPALTFLLAVMMAALIGGGWRIYHLIAALAQNEAALDRSLHAAEAANAAKSQFLANMSHELRTPLNGIIAMSELLKVRQTDPRSQDMADTIIASSRTLEHVVNDILDVSKIEAGQMIFEMSAFDLGRLLHEVTDLHGAAAVAKGIRLEVVISPAASGRYEGDRNRVAQVLSNLLSNAVKFTDHGVIRVHARRNQAGLRIAVADTGVGFDRETARRIFQRFEQGDVSVSRKFGGTGLGLSISNSLVQMMGGRLTVRSTQHRGTCFIVGLPLQRVGDAQPLADTGAPPPAVADSPRPAIRVLFADDHDVNRQIVGLILEPLGFDLTPVSNGAEAVEAARAADYDLILMDVQMPVLDGLTATQKIREFEAADGRTRTPIIFLTANAMPDDLDRSREAGGDLHISKPIRPDALIAAIDTVMANGSTLAAA